MFSFDKTCSASQIHFYGWCWRWTEKFLKMWWGERKERILASYDKAKSNYQHENFMNRLYLLTKYTWKTETLYVMFARDWNASPQVWVKKNLQWRIIKIWGMLKEPQVTEIWKNKFIRFLCPRIQGFSVSILGSGKYRSPLCTNLNHFPLKIQLQWAVYVSSRKLVTRIDAVCKIRVHRLRNCDSWYIVN